MSYSATIRLELHVDDKVFSLRQTGPDFIDVRQPVEMVPCEADVVVWIDGSEYRRRVSLVDGMSPSCERIKILGLSSSRLIPVTSGTD
jgi:hypothetical protein